MNQDMKNKIKVLITGAGGHIGQELIKQITKPRYKNVEVHLFDLNTPKNREYFDRYLGQVVPHFGDITNPETYGDAVKGVDLVLHLASIIPPLAHKKPALAYNVNVFGTTQLVRALEQYSPEAMIVMASSVAVYGDRLLNPLISTTDPLQPSEGDNYGETKVEMEAIIQSSSLRWSIYRLAAIMGAGNHNSPEMMFDVPLEQIIEICTPQDTARALLHTIDHMDEVEGRIFNLGGGKACTTTFQDFLQKNFEIYGLGALDFPQNAFATKNFHCGYYTDGDELNDILHFRHDTLEDYYETLRKSVPSIQRWLTKGVARIAKDYLLSKSKPYQAWLTQDEEALQHFFRS